MSISSGCMLFKTADLRTDTSKNKLDEDRAIALIEKMAKAHRTDLLLDMDTYSATVTEEFFGLIGKKGNPYKESKQN